MRETRADLVAHVGGRPSVTQAMLIDGAVQLTLRLAMMDRALAQTGVQTDHDRDQYLAWRGSLNRLLRDLGMKSAAQRQPSLAEHRAARAAAA